MGKIRKRIKRERCTQETVAFNEEEFKGMIDLLNPAWFIGWETIDHVASAKRELNKSGKIFMYEEKKRE